MVHTSSASVAPPDRWSREVTCAILKTGAIVSGVGARPGGRWDEQSPELAVTPLRHAEQHRLAPQNAGSYPSALRENRGDVSSPTFRLQTNLPNLRYTIESGVAE